MKICIVGRGDLQLFPPLEGGSNKIYYTLKYLSLKGIKVFYVSSEHPFYFEVFKGNVKKKPYPSSLSKPVDIEQIKKIIRELLGIPSEECILYHPLFNTQLVKKLMYVVRKERPQLIQAEFIGFAFPAAVVKFLFGLPVILVEHNVECLRIKEIFPQFKRGLLFSKLIEVALNKVSDVVITSTVEDKMRLTSLGIKKSKIVVIPHGVEVKKFEKGNGRKIRKKLNLHGTVLIFHGVLSYKPNLWAVKYIANHLIPYLRKKRVDFSVLIVGNYPPPDIKEREIVFTGVVNNLQDYIDAADIAIVPLIAGGGMRIKILEYFAAKKPVVSTPKGIEGIHVENFKHAIITPLDEFPKYVYELIKNKKLRNYLVKNAFEFVKDFDWKKITEGYLDAFRRVL